MKGRSRQMICFLLGLGLCAFPIISSKIEAGKQHAAVRTYEDAVEQEENTESILQSAGRYNELLWQTKGAVVGDLNEEELSEESYQKQLNVSGTGVMGAIEIPKIDVNLPIWHGTAEEVLSNGAGHLRESSLPVGGVNTRCVLTSHRGLPSSKLFTRLDELETGDLFYIRTCGQTLAYQVCNIEVIEPDEIEKLQIVSEKDLATLVTCTPYGINTHRLIVDGERVPYQKAAYDRIRPNMFSLRELCFFLLPFVLLGTAVWKFWKERRKKRCKEYEKKKKRYPYDKSVPSRVLSDRRKRTGRRKRSHSHPARRRRKRDF